ncbi:uncharacterized protein [Bemisia tabaci]|uniref:uncharacterized protein isoform X2 n=1 Tax=Bemisia tabaci TaxID=7038 RepID=UPI003B282E63
MTFSRNMLSLPYMIYHTVDHSSDPQTTSLLNMVPEISHYCHPSSAEIFHLVPFIRKIDEPPRLPHTIIYYSLSTFKLLHHPFFDNCFCFFPVSFPVVLAPFYPTYKVTTTTTKNKVQDSSSVFQPTTHSSQQCKTFQKMGSNEELKNFLEQALRNALQTALVNFQQTPPPPQ